MKKGFKTFTPEMNDSERLDWLQRFIDENGALVIHNHVKPNLTCGYLGLGLRPDRTLRQAIDSAMRAEEKND